MNIIRRTLNEMAMKRSLGTIASRTVPISVDMVVVIVSEMNEITGS